MQDHNLYFSLTAVGLNVCEMYTTCLAPDVIIKPEGSIPIPRNVFITNSSIQANWSLPHLRQCCADTVFSYPLAQYTYEVSSTQFQPEVSTFTPNIMY